MGAAAVYAGQAVHGVFSGGEQHEQQEDTRPPQLDASSRLTDNIAQNWRWLSLRCERRLAGRTIPGRMGEGAELDNLNQFACFVPRTVLEAIKDNRIRATDDFDIIIERFNAAVVFCDASGFTALTEALDKQPNGAEKLGQAINSFFTPLIQTVDKWGGDIIKFSGDALTIVWPCDDEAGDEDEDDETFDPRGAFGYDEEEEEPPPSARRIEFAEDASAGRRRNSISGKSSPERRPFRRSGTLKTCGVDLDESSSSPPAGERGHRNSAEMRSLSSLSVKPVEYRVDKRQATMLAVQCCLELHEILHNFPTPIPDKFFTLHIGVGFGEVTILQVGGTLDRWEYVVAGPPLQQISVAEPLASSGETVLSPQAVDAMGAENGELDVVLALDGTPYFKVLGLKGQSLTPPPPLEDISLQTSHISLVRRFIPPAIFTQLTSGYNVFVNELRMISVVFVGVRGLDVSNDRGSGIAHKLMQLTQKAAYTMEGSVNKFLVDDKGVLILIMFGLPPVFHLDDPIRAVMASMRVADGLKELRLNAGIGVASGRVWCGTVGCDLRKEYTAMGDSVNLSARLMGKADKNEIFVDLETKKQCEHSMEFRALEPVMMKGKQHPVPLFQPTGQMKRGGGGVSEDTLASWPDWKPRKLLQRVLSPPFQYRPPVVGLDKPLCLADTPDSLPWRTVDPWMPTLQRLSDAGGVIVIRGKEGMGTGELADILREKVQSELNRTCFYCSNMPDATHVNIGNVPLLAWRTLCTDVVKSWQQSEARANRGFSKINRDDSTYGLAKELIHPLFHWRLDEMDPVLKDLKPRPVRSLTRGVTRMKTTDTRGDPAEKSDEAEERAYESIEAIAPAICSLLSGYTATIPTVVVLHVKRGTSRFGQMDGDSWRVARFVGRLAMLRRRGKMEGDMSVLEAFREKHSWNCSWCQQARNSTSAAKPGPKCCPKFSPAPAFIFVAICSDETDHLPEQQELIQWAKECNAFIPIRTFMPSETQQYLAHSLGVLPNALPQDLVDYVYRVSGGVPRFVNLTKDQLLRQQTIQIETTADSSSLTSTSPRREEASELCRSRDEVSTLMEELGCVSSTLYASSNFAISPNGRIKLEAWRPYELSAVSKAANGDLLLSSEVGGCDSADSESLCPNGPAEFRLARGGQSLKGAGPSPRAPAVEDGIARRRVICTVADLGRLTFAPEIRASCMTLYERLSDDEQLAAKCVAVFPLPFSAYELRAVFPRPHSAESFAKIFISLVGSGVLQRTSPPSGREIDELDLQQHEATTLISGSDLGGGEDRRPISQFDADSAFAVDEDGAPLFYRLESIVLEQVLKDLCPSEEAETFMRTARAAIVARIQFGVARLWEFSELKHSSGKQSSRSVNGGRRRAQSAHPSSSASFPYEEATEVIAQA